MNEKEFSDRFDTLLNSYKQSAPYGYEQGILDFTLNEYEKSVYLTQAQEQFVESYFKQSTEIDNTFEGSEYARKSIEALVRDLELSPVSVSSHQHIVKDSQFFMLPNNLADDSQLWFIIYEAVKYDTDPAHEDSVKGCDKEMINNLGYGYTNVIPITYDDFYRTYHNPFRGASNRRALRLNAGDKLYEVVSKFPIDKYYIRYVAKPEPIILENLPDGLTIEGVATKQTCKLDDSLHDTILSMAVQLALQYHNLTASATSVPQTTKPSRRKKDDDDD